MNVVRDNGKVFIYGMSTDTKADAIDALDTNGDVVVFREMDTGKDYVFNDGDWYEFAIGGGGGGGGGGGSWSWMGKNPTKVITYANEKAYLKDTPYATWEPTTTQTTLSGSTSYDSFTPDTSKDYYILYRWHTHFEYADGTEMKNLITDLYSVGGQATFGYPASYVKAQTNSVSSWNSDGASQSVWVFYKTGAGANEMTVSNYGVYCSVPTPTISTTTLKFKSPAINARCNDSYFSTANAAAVNQETSYYEYTVELHSVDRGTFQSSGNVTETYDMYINGF